jgi:hypothetical protein
MPATAEFIDAMREAFGREGVDDAIRWGMRGEPEFHAIEGGQEVGTPIGPGDFTVQLFGPERHERTAEGQAELKIKTLNTPKGKGRSKWPR